MVVGGDGGRLLSLREAYVLSLSLLLSLELFEKFVVGGGGWLRPILVFSLSLVQAEQYQPIDVKF